MLKSTEVIQIWEFDNLHMTQCAKVIVGFVANVGNVFYPTFTNVFFLIFSTFLRFLTFFFYFHLNVCYIYGSFTLQIGVGNEVSLDELMDVASEPHEFNVFLASNFSALTQTIADRLSNVLCNSKQS